MVKKTKTGKLVFEFDLLIGEMITRALIDFLQSEEMDVRFCSLTEQHGVMMRLHYCVLNELAYKHSFFIGKRRVRLRHSEAVALMWLLRGYDNNQHLLQLKSALHQNLL